MLYAYDDAFHPGRPSAPPIPEDLRARLRTDEHVATSSTRTSRDVEVMVRTPWGTGPCAYVLAHGTTDPSWGAVLPESPLWLLPIGVVLAAVLVGVGPVLRRIRRLTEAASRSASVSYANVVTASGDDEISELARAFDAAAREVQSQLQAKERREKALRDFLANTTHDVMIPLTVLQGHLATLRARAEEGPEADRAVLVSAMDEAHYMASLVHNLAMVARFDADDVILQKSDVDLNALVQRVVGRHAPIARQLGVSIESAVPEEPVVVFADVTLLEQAVSNVTYNAIRYNERNGHVAIILEALRGGAFSLRVIDDGPGVPDAAMAALTQRGMRSDEARTRVPEGQGLGLHIAHRAVELHGYQLRFDQSEYGGLEVTLEGSA